MANKAALIILWIAYLLMVFFISYISDTGIDMVFLGTSPILLYLFVFAGFLLERRSLVVWIAPLIFPLIFFGLWSSQSIALLNSLDGLQLSVFDILISYGITVLGVIFYGGDISEKKDQKARQMTPSPNLNQGMHPNNPHQKAATPITQKSIQIHQRMHPGQRPMQQRMPAHQAHKRPLQQLQKPQPSQQVHQQALMHAQQKHQQQMQQAYNQYTSHLNQYHQQNQQYVQEVHKLRKQVSDLEQKQKITRENFQLNLKGIEDKCKAINFVIGRVYSDKKGGSKEIREAIHIPRELYNSFSQLSKEMKQEHLGMLLRIMEAIHKKLLQMEMPESRLFSTKKDARIDLKRKGDGSDKILDVLASNDQDPISEYHKEAKEICTRLSEFLRKNYK